MRAAVSDDRGAIAVYAALAMPLLLGSIGLGVDVGLTYSSRQSAQARAQADAAAMSAAPELARGKTVDEARTSATHDAGENGFVEARGDTIAVNSPPASPP